MRTQFHNRTEAGQLLAGQLSAYTNRPDVIVLALPRGGVPVAAEVANRLNAPLDVFVVRKLALPGHPELAMGPRRHRRRACIERRCRRFTPNPG